MTSIPAAVNSPTKFITANERKLAYRSIGNGEPLILYQRFRGTPDDWDPVFLDALAENFTMITFDYTGIAAPDWWPATSSNLYSRTNTNKTNLYADHNQTDRLRYRRICYESMLG